MPIAIVGSGRSGTSMVAGMLNVCGVYLGSDEDVRNADHTNEKGSFEHGRLNELNERLLLQLGGSYVRPPKAASNWEDDPALDPLYAEARQLIARIFGDRALWGWKMPRAAFTIPFWRRLIPEMKFVVCLRNPLDFASSLERYEGFGRSYCFALWLEYTIAVLANTRPEERFITSYEEYFPDYRSGLCPLLEFLGLPAPERGGAIDLAIAEFHTPGLRHHSSSADDLRNDSSAPSDVKVLYTQLREGARDGANAVPAHGYEPVAERAREIIDRDRRAAAIERKRLVDRIAALEGILDSRTHRVASRISSVAASLRGRRETRR